MEQLKVESISNDPQESVEEASKENMVKEEEEEKSAELKTEEMVTDTEDILVDHLRIEPAVTEIITEIIPIAVDNETTVTECLDKDIDANNQPNYEVSGEIVEVVCIAETVNTDVVNTDEVITQKETMYDSANDETPNNSTKEEETQNDSTNEETSNILFNEEIPNDSINDKTSSFIVETKRDELQDSEDASLSTDMTLHIEQIDGDANTENVQEIEEDSNIVEENIEAHETCDPNTISVVEEIVTTSKTMTYSIEIQEQDSSDDRDCFAEKNLLMLEVVSENDSSVNVFEGSIQELEIEHTGDYDTGGENLSKQVSLSEDNKIDSNNESFEKKELDDNTSELFTTETVRIEIIENDEAESDTIEEEEAAQEEAKENKNMSVKKENHRSVIQEIVDDWIDDTNDDIPDSKDTSNDYHDSVEIELKTLLAEDKSIEREEKFVKGGERATEKSSNPIKFSLKHKKTRKNTGSAAKEHLNGLENESASGECNMTIDENSSSIEQSETVSNYIGPHVLRKSATDPSQDVIVSKQKPQLTKAGAKIPARHLLSQIASRAEVTEVLQERIKEKQKDTERPQRGDLLFVKKITQRLSSKLSAASTHSLTGKKSASSNILNISSENYSNNLSEEKIADDAERIETVDNRELLAILEGDVDPDWSNLKPQSVVEASKSSEVIADASTPAKLDPLMERELALKQLLELPTMSVKKNSAKKKRTFKPAPSKATSNKDSVRNAVKPTVAAADSESTENLSAEGNDAVPMIEATIKSDEARMDTEESHLEESRSGRKRKPTEKAREHEENSTKRQKVYKGKITEQKKSPKVQPTASEPPCEPQLHDESVEEVKEEPADPKPVTSRNILSKIGPTKNRMYQSKAQRMGKKLSQNIAKRNMPVKKLLRQKPSTSVANSKSVHMKPKFISSPKKYRNTMKQKVDKNLSDEVQSSDVKPKKKSNEIDKLLQDEGVVNLLYDVEQPERKRLVPITKSQTKVMDLQKVQRELKIRTKLVRNAVLRLRTSGGSPTKMSPRSKRNAMQISSPEIENRENDRNKSTRSSISSSGDFTFPAKIRNAADASVIVRRHSSSSFSSTSGSPRVSIDGPDRQTEPCGSEEGPAHVTRSAKRRHSQNEKNKQCTDSTPTQKKMIVSRKKSMDVVTDNEGSAPVVEKSGTPVRSTLKTEIKTPEKMNKNIESTDIGKPGGVDSGSKVATRSNGVSSEKEVIKTKKGTKTKAVLNRSKDVVESEIEYIEEDKLSACLAEAVSALSSVEETNGRPGSRTANRKPKTFANINKTTDQSKPDVLDHLENTEINLRRHGNIVQVILTPSSNKLKNGITLQIMHELREALLMLRKDEACRVVLLTSTGTSFCEGLDLSNLVHTNREERRIHAEEMANGVKEFIKTLANFNKPIVAGIQGAAVGLGVTMLPLFDLVIASDKATFSTPYGQLGQIPEGAAILTLSQTIGNTITSELLLGGRILTASEALRAGLVTRVLWPDRFQGELIPSLRTMSEQSSQSMEATKTLLRHSLRKKLDAALESESYLLIQHWCSAECQTLIRNYLDGKDH